MNEPHRMKKRLLHRNLPRINPLVTIQRRMPVYYLPRESFDIADDWMSAA